MHIRELPLTSLGTILERRVLDTFSERNTPGKRKTLSKDMSAALRLLHIISPEEKVLGVGLLPAGGFCLLIEAPSPIEVVSGAPDPQPGPALPTQHGG